MRALYGWVATLLVLALPAGAIELPGIPGKPETAMFKDTPALWRDYLIKARAAEGIADPLQRCLAFPDLPGNHWPAGHAAAHCRHHFELKRPTLEEIDRLVEQGNLSQLEAMFDQSLARHYSEDHFGDDIHDTFNYLFERIGEVDRIDRITAAWLEQAPDSAYANLARGAYFNALAGSARGSKYAEQTPPENMRRMGRLIDHALPYYDKAVAINPRLIAAYTAMVDMGMMDSRPELKQRGIREAKKLDPACPELALRIMYSLTPRWGGSYEQMLAYAEELRGYLPGRPQLAINMAAPYVDRGNRLEAADQYTPETMAVLDTAVGIGSNEGALSAAAEAALNLPGDMDDDNKALAYLLQLSRFAEPNVPSQRQIALALVQSEPEWSLRYALPAIAREPDNGLGHYLAGAGFYNSRRYEEADREYGLAIKDDDQRQAALREVAQMWLWRGNTDDAAVRKINIKNAKPYIDRLVREYPEDGRGAIMAQWARLFETQRVFDDELRAVLDKVDRSDPWQVEHSRDFERMLRQAEQMKKRSE